MYHLITGLFFYFFIPKNQMCWSSLQKETFPTEKMRDDKIAAKSLNISKYWPHHHIVFLFQSQKSKEKKLKWLS